MVNWGGFSTKMAKLMKANVNHSGMAQNLIQRSREMMADIVGVLEPYRVDDGDSREGTLKAWRLF